jgi:hypothetical protein
MIGRLAEGQGHVQRRVAQFSHSGVLLEGGRVAAALDLGDRENATADHDNGEGEQDADADVRGDNREPPGSDRPPRRPA